MSYSSFIGSDGKGRTVSTADRLPVDIGGATVNIDGDVTVSSEVEVKNDVGNPVPASVASLPLPTGASTEAKQDTLIAAVDGVEGLLTTIDADTGSIDSKLPALSSGAIPVTGPLTDTQLRASSVPVAPNISRGSGVMDANTTRVTLATDGPTVAALSSIAGLTIPAHDYIALTYTGTNLTGVQYRTGGATGTIVGTLTLAYSGSNLTSVTKS